MQFGIWRKITNQEEANQFLERVQYFRDAILRESKFSQGAFINENLALSISHKPHLRCLFQRQKQEPEVVEIFFVNVETIRLCSMPYDAIEEGTIRVSEGKLLWSDCSDIQLEKSSLVSSDFAYWREIKGWLGPRERYSAVQPEDVEYYIPEKDCEMLDVSLRGGGQPL